MKRLLVVSVLGLAGCVMTSTTHVYTDQSVVHTHAELNTHAVSETHVKEAVKPPPVTKVIERQVETASNCPVFELPVAGIRPSAPNFESATFVTGADIDEALGVYIVALTAYINNERTRIERHYAEYLRRCGQ